MSEASHSDFSFLRGVEPAQHKHGAGKGDEPSHRVEFHKEIALLRSGWTGWSGVKALIERGIYPAQLAGPTAFYICPTNAPFAA